MIGVGRDSLISALPLLGQGVPEGNRSNNNYTIMCDSWSLFSTSVSSTSWLRAIRPQHKLP